MKSNGEIRATDFSLGAVATELTGSINDSQITEGAGDLCSVAIDADAIPRTIAFAVKQPAAVDEQMSSKKSSLEQAASKHRHL